VIGQLAASMGMAPGDPAFWMPLLFTALLYALIAGGVVLDGFDLGVGLLLRAAPSSQRARLMTLLSPWRDANEFWLLLGAGLFAAAFPFAWGAVLGHLFLPLAVMTAGAVLRSVAFEFRLRSSMAMRPRWIAAFWLGSLASALAQGVVLGHIVTGYRGDAVYHLFAVFVGLCAVSAYALLGATWLVMRVEGALQALAVAWARHAIRWAAAGMVAVSVALGLANAGIFQKWTALSDLRMAAALWLAMLGCFVLIELLLARLPRPRYARLSAVPFLLTVLVFLLMLAGLAYSLFPYLILDDMTVWDGAAAVDSLRLVLAATVVAVPVLLVFNLLVYRSLFGKEKLPSYMAGAPATSVSVAGIPAAGVPAAGGAAGYAGGASASGSLTETSRPPESA